MRLFNITITALLLDLSSKIFCQQYLQKPLSIINNFFQLQLAYNDGIAFSLPLKGILNITISSLLIISIVRYYYKNSLFKSKFYQLAFGLILGGAFGNLRERIFIGTITDFISIGNFPIFNLADSFIFIGVCLMFYKEIKAK